MEKEKNTYMPTGRLFSKIFIWLKKSGDGKEICKICNEALNANLTRYCTRIKKKADENKK